MSSFENLLPKKKCQLDSKIKRTFVQDSLEEFGMGTTKKCLKFHIVKTCPGIEVLQSLL